MGTEGKPGGARVYAVVISRDARLLMAGWPDEVRASMERRLEQLAELPVDSQSGAVHSVVREGTAGEFRLSVELQPDASRLVVTPA